MIRTRSASVGVMIASDPITPIITIEEGSTPPFQRVLEGLHSPDWATTNLVLTPRLDLIDPDNVLNGQKPTYETDTKWEAIEDGVTTLLTASGTHNDYEIDTTTFVLKWKRNLDPGKSITFRFTGAFTVSGQTYKTAGTLTVHCVQESHKVPVIELDKPLTQKYCFLRESGDIVVTATLVGSDKVFTATGDNPDCAFVWFRKDSSGDWVRIYPDAHAKYNIMDYDVEVDAADSSKLIIRRELMGDSISIMCRAWYIEDGVTYGGGIVLDSSYNSDGTLDLSANIGDSPAAYYATERFLGKTYEDILNIRNTYSDPSTVLTPEAYISDQKGQIPDVEKSLKIKWNTVSGTTVTAIAEGLKPSIPVSQINGKLLQMTMEDRGCFKSIKHNGNLLTFNNKILVYK